MKGNDFEITAIVKLAHGRLLSVVESMGGIVAAAKELGVSAAVLRNWVYLRAMPACGSVKGRPWRPGSNRANVREAVRRLCELAEASPEELFPGYVRESLTGKSLTQRITKSVSAVALTESRAKQLSYEPDNDNGLFHEELKKRIGGVLDTLTYRERQVIKLRFGLDDGMTYTLEEVGHIFKVSKDRIRQIENKAIRKLQQPQRASELEPCL